MAKSYADVVFRTLEVDPGLWPEGAHGLRERGKSAKVALIACMRVLLIRLNAMLRDGTEWR